MSPPAGIRKVFSHVSGNLVMEMLRAIRGDIGDLKTAMIELKERLRLLEAQGASISRRVDRIDGEGEQVGRRRETVPAE
jgi:hypothetical protein